MYRRVKLILTKDLEVEFTDREKALSQIEDIARKGTRFPLTIYGPEGCGKTALFKQAKAILEEHGYNVVYVNPLAREVGGILQYSTSIRDVVRDVLKLFPDPFSKIVDVAISIAGEVMRRLKKPRIAVLMDDLFQAIGLNKAEAYTKTLLNLIEYPPGDYENIVVLVSSSEGVTRDRIGRHRWATIRVMWNMGRRGFRELYDKIPGRKPVFEETWRWAGGNPSILAKLIEVNWSRSQLVDEIVRARKLDKLVMRLSSEELEILKQAIEDPDIVFKKLGEEAGYSLEKKLVELNLITEIWDREEYLWIDAPPPLKDLELGIGKHYAWQTPVHRDAVRKAIKQVIQE